uniref:Uncharacterized protein n=1 Tax=Rhizophora mucronata TaxID=61149 RepID=A0A2P2PW14_RHIMU
MFLVLLLLNVLVLLLLLSFSVCSTKAQIVTLS